MILSWHTHTHTHTHTLQPFPKLAKRSKKSSQKLLPTAKKEKLQIWNSLSLSKKTNKVEIKRNFSGNFSLVTGLFMWWKHAFCYTSSCHVKLANEELQGGVKVHVSAKFRNLVTSFQNAVGRSYTCDLCHFWLDILLLFTCFGKSCRGAVFRGLEEPVERFLVASTTPSPSSCHGQKEEERREEGTVDTSLLWSLSKTTEKQTNRFLNLCASNCD